MLPFATRDGGGASFMDALFTATSAVCVTGLVVQDTVTYWTVFGQGVILLLIQIGGMGVVTVAVAVFVASGKRIGLKERSTMQEAISANHVGGIIRLTGFIVKAAVCFELLGAIVMAPAFCREFGTVRGIWYAVFHSISAFCNAGFDLMGDRAPYSSLTHFAASPSINLTIMCLIVIGGIGFLTWEDIWTKKFRIRKYRMQTKVILTTTALLILAPAVYFFLNEFQDMPPGQRVLCALFQAVTPRTAGFNTVDLGLLSGHAIGVIVLLMLVGGSPGSTAGGFKTTTLAVMLSSAVSVFRRREHVHFFGRRIDDVTVQSAMAVLSMYLVLFLGGGFFISHMEGLPLSECLFEAASAVATVGLTLGITPDLGLASRFVLILLMYIGRVGGLTLIFAALPGKKSVTERLPQEKLNVV
ncbi:MAG: Trk family potassium uptake protein [Lachnospiraceae bacterium]|nr:Trk family potassium uptake protein [Lachnospiraceae bacterium]